MSKTGRPAMAATRPHISAYTQMPITPTTSTHTCPVPNRAPISELATMSPMSTKPPMAVRMPRVMARIFFIGESPVPFDEGAQLRRERFDAGQRGPPGRTVVQAAGQRQVAVHRVGLGEQWRQ